MRDSAGYDRFGGYKALKFKPRGFFYLQQTADGTWWLVTPEGYCFYSTGINYVTPEGFFCPKQGEFPYDYRSGLDIWKQRTIQRLKEWGFNTLGAWSSESLFDQGMPFTILLHLLHKAGADWLEMYFPDIFSDYSREKIFAYARKVCSKYRDNPYLIGYFTDNEIFWGSDWRARKSLFDIYFSYPPDAEGKKALVSFFENRYNRNFEKFSSVWMSRAKSFQQLLDVEKVYAKNPFRAACDKTDFLGFVAERYYKLVRDAIMTYDPNHLLLGTRFAIGVQRPVLEAAAKYCDVLSINFYWYSWYHFLVDLYNLRHKNVATVNWLYNYYRLTHRPLLVSEFSFKARDSRLPNTLGAGPVFTSQKVRGIHYEIYSKRCASRKYIIGHHWYCYMDEPREGRAYDYEDGNYGVVDVADRPYKNFIQYVEASNSSVYRLRIKTS